MKEAPHTLLSITFFLGGFTVMQCSMAHKTKKNIEMDGLFSSVFVCARACTYMCVHACVYVYYTRVLVCAYAAVCMCVYICVHPCGGQRSFFRNSYWLGICQVVMDWLPLNVPVSTSLASDFLYRFLEIKPRTTCSHGEHFTDSHFPQS